MLVDAREYQRGFVPYGTQCSERFDPQTQQLEILKCELESMRARLAALMEERAAEKLAAERKAAEERDCA